jgi:hypothetical protein
MVKLLMAASAAFFLVCAPASAQIIAPACTPLEDAKPQIAKATLAFDVLSGDRAARALAMLKEGDESQDIDTVVIGVVANESGDVDLVLFFGHGGICKAVKVPEAAMIKVFNHIYGYPA